MTPASGNHLRATGPPLMRAIIPQPHPPRPRLRGWNARPPARPAPDTAQREGVAASRSQAPARQPPRGRGAVVGLVLGSVTLRLLHVAPCPVLAVPAAEHSTHGVAAEAGVAGE